MQIKLYHFTAQEFVPAIVADGLSLGDVPTDFDTGINAVWMTIDHSAASQNWTDGSSLNKREIRFTLDFDPSDPLLIKWTNFAKDNVNPGMYRRLHRGGGKRSEDWYVYFGTIPWFRVLAVTDMSTGEDLGTTLSFSNEMIELSRVLSAAAQMALKEQLEAIKAKPG